MKPFLLLPVLILTLAAPAHAALVGAKWADLAGGNWYDATKWEPMVIPNGSTTYEVEMSPFGATVTLDHFATTGVFSLKVGSTSATLLVGSTLHVGAGGILNIGRIEIVDTIQFSAEDTVLRGSGIYHLASGKLAGIGGPGSAADLILESPITGYGQLSGHLINRSTVTAQLGTLTISPNAAGFDNSEGILRVEVDPALPAFSRLVLNPGNYANTGGMIESTNTTELQLNSAQILGGTLRSLGTGFVSAVGQSSLLRDVSFGGVLEVAVGAQVILGGDITNSGTWNLNGRDATASVTLRIDTNVDLLGDGEIVGSDSNTNTIAGSGFLRNRAHTISGAMRIEVVMQNDADGVLLANAATPGSAMTLGSAYDMVHDGIALATGMGTLQIFNTVTGNGSWRADNGTIVTRRAEIGTCGPLTVEDGGHLQLEGSRFRAASFRLGPGGSLLAFHGTLFGAPVPEFLLTDSLVIESQDELDWNVQQFPETTFTFYGGRAAGGCEASTVPGTPFIEVAGTDGGDVRSYSEDNFELPLLVIGAGAQVQLADVVDNGNRNGPGGEDEALYVNTLEFKDGAGRLARNGLPLYYKNLIGDASQITAVPEPHAAAQLVAALGALACLVGRRTR